MASQNDSNPKNEERKVVLRKQEEKKKKTAGSTEDRRNIPESLKKLQEAKYIVSLEPLES